MISRAKQIPWVRVLVEGFVIVASILLALALDAWWDGVQERKAERNYLVALRGELETVQAELSGDQDRRTRRYEATQDLVDAIASQPAVPPDNISALLQSLWGSQRLNPPSAIHNDLEIAGSIDLVTSVAIRRELLKYGQVLNRLMWQEERLRETWESELRPYLVAETDVLRHIPLSAGVSDEWLPPPVYDSGFESALHDRTFQNLLLVRLRRLSIVMVNADALLEQIRHLLVLIDEEAS